MPDTPPRCALFPRLPKAHVAGTHHSLGWSAAQPQDQKQNRLALKERPKQPVPLASSRARHPRRCRGLFGKRNRLLRAINGPCLRRGVDAAPLARPSSLSLIAPHLHLSFREKPPRPPTSGEAEESLAIRDVAQYKKPHAMPPASTPVPRDAVALNAQRSLNFVRDDGRRRCLMGGRISFRPKVSSTFPPNKKPILANKGLTKCVS